MRILADQWKEYTLIDAGGGEKLEQWQNILLRRPDPVAIWPRDPRETRWQTPDAVYHRSHAGGGEWEMKTTLPADWQIHYKQLTFKVSPTGFKHTGIFPEQAANWDWLMDLIQAHAQEHLHILNLFAYTGAATMACAAAGAEEVVHVDAARGMVQWAKENMKLCGLEDHRIRFIVDDCRKFVEREKRRGRTYQGILMDPPSYGRGPDGELWKFEREVPALIEACLDILDPQPLFFLISSYSAGYSPAVIENLLQTTVAAAHPRGLLTVGELALPMAGRRLVLPCGIAGRWQRHD